MEKQKKEGIVKRRGIQSEREEESDEMIEKSAERKREREKERGREKIKRGGSRRKERE